MPGVLVRSNSVQLAFALTILIQISKTLSPQNIGAGIQTIFEVYFSLLDIHIIPKFHSQSESN